MPTHIGVMGTSLPGARSARAKRSRTIIGNSTQDFAPPSWENVATGVVRLRVATPLNNKPPVPSDLSVVESNAGPCTPPAERKPKRHPRTPAMSAYKSDFLNVLAERGFIHQVSEPDILDVRAKAGTITAYIGFDCTAASLHVGSLLPIMMLYWLQQTGHRPIALMGGGT